MVSVFSLLQRWEVVTSFIDEQQFALFEERISWFHRNHPLKASVYERNFEF